MINNPLIHVFFYVLGLSLFLIATNIAPTNLAGPGLDLLVIIVFVVMIPCFLLSNILAKTTAKRDKVLTIITHAAGVSLLIYLLNMPVYYCQHIF